MSSNQSIPHRPQLLLSLMLAALLFGVGCGPLLLPGHTAGGLSRDRQQCVECGLRDGTDDYSDGRAAKEFKIWCKAGDPASCSALGVMYQTGRGVPQNVAKAETLFQGACQEGNGTACVNLGQLLSGSHGRRQDLTGAAVMFEMACAQGELGGCFQLGQLHYTAGRSAAAAAIFDNSCKANHGPSCETLGVMFAHGLGLTPDTLRAQHLFRRACLGGQTSACERLGRLTAPTRAQSLL